MNNDPGEDKQNPNEINHNASLAEKRGESVVENGEKEPASGTSEKSSGDILKEEKIEETEVPQEFSRLQELCAQAGIEVMIATIGNIEILTSEEIKNISLRVQEALRNFTAEQLNEIHQKGVNRVILDKDNTGTRILGIGADFYIDRNTETSEIVNFIKENILGIQPEIQTQVENKPEEPKQDAKALSEKIESAEDKNSKNLVVGSRVSWDSLDGNATNGGNVISFEKDEFGNIVANVKPDSDPEFELKILPNWLSLVEDGVSQTEQPVANPEQASVPEWRRGPEWQAMEEARNRAVACKAEYEKALSSGASEEEKSRLQNISNEAVLAYGQSRKAVEQKIREQLFGVNYDNLSPEEKKKFDSGVKLKIMEEIYLGEAKAFRQAQEDYGKEKKEGGILNSAKEAYAKVLSNKVVKGYLGIKWYYRIPATTLLFTLAGYGLGMAAVGTTVTSAAGFAGARMARGALTIAGGSVLRGTIHKGGEKLEEKRKELLKNLSEQNLDELETIRTTRAINERYDRIQKWVKGAKVASAFGVAGAGMWAGMGSGKAAESVADAGSSPAPSVPAGEDIVVRDIERVRMPDLEGNRPEVPDVVEGLPMKVEVAQGDSTWKILERMMENNKEFKNLSGDPEHPEEVLAKKNFVISNLANEAIKNAEKIGLGPDGSLKVGDKLNFANLFADKPKIDELIEKAQNLSSDKVKNILENNAKIAQWVANPENAGKPLTSDQVSEILSQKVDSPKVAMPSSSEAYYDDTETKEDLGSVEKSGQENLLSEEEEIARAKAPDDFDVDAKISEINYKLESSILKSRFPEGVKDLAARLAEIEERRQLLNSMSPTDPKFEFEWNKLSKDTEDVGIELQKLTNQILNDKSGPLNQMAKDFESIKPRIDEQIQKAQQDTEADRFMSAKVKSDFEKMSPMGNLGKAKSLLDDLQDISAERKSITDRLKEIYEKNPADLTDQELKETQELTDKLIQLGNKHSEISREILRELNPRPDDVGNSSSGAVGSDFENKSAPNTQGANSEEGLRNLRSFKNDTEFMQELQTGINRDLDGIYAKKGLFGGIKVRGALSPEFLQMANKPAGLVMQYAENPRNTTLDTGTIDMIEKSSNHQRFINMVRGLRETVSKVRDINSEDLKPFDNENMQSYHRRLGEIMLKSKSRN